MIPVLTMTGIDAKTGASWIKKMERDFHINGRSIEFGILRSPKVGQSARYPTAKEIQQITNYVYPGQLAFHLCGRYADMVHDLEWSELCDIIDFDLVSRVQVNSVKDDEKAIVTLQRFSVHIGKPVIMQWRHNPFPCAVGLHLLQDRSGGRGTTETEWFKPDPICYQSNTTFVGFAGGLTPENVGDAIKVMNQRTGRKNFWVDCESGIRTDNWFDTAKAEAMAHAVFKARGLSYGVQK